MEIVITIVAGIALLLAVCIIALVMRQKCSRQPEPNQPTYNQSTLSSSGGYATTKAHTRSSWMCTYKSGKQVTSHIWEAPLPEPSAPPAVEYTLPSNLRQSVLYNNHPGPSAMQGQTEYAMHSYMRQSLLYENHPGPSEMPGTVEYTLPNKTRSTQLYEDNPEHFNPGQVEYTLPANMRHTHLDDSAVISAPPESDYTMPTNMRYSNPHANISDESEYTLPTNMRPQSHEDTSESIQIDPLHYGQYSKVLAELSKPVPTVLSPAPSPACALSPAPSDNLSLPVQETKEAIYKTLIRGEEMN